MPLDIKTFKPGDTAYCLRIRQRYEPDPSVTNENLAYNAYISQTEVQAVGRKFVTTKNGTKYKVPEGNDNTNWLTEHSQYSPEYYLFPTHQDAAAHILKHKTLDNIRNMAGRIPFFTTDLKTLKEIEQLIQQTIKNHETKS